MATILPDGWAALTTTGAAQREIDTLEHFSQTLPDDYTVYHGIHWSRFEQGFSTFGRIHFIIVNRTGNLLLIEQKTGFLSETEYGLVKRIAGKEEIIATELNRQRSALLKKLNARPECAHISIDFLFYCPDYHVRTPLTAGLEPKHIIDHGRRAQLSDIVMQHLPAGDTTPAAAEVHRFLRDEIQLEPDVSALLGRAHQLVTRISGGLAQWVRQLDADPLRLHVTGTAGSGKTQLALAEYCAAIKAGKRPLYLCFNRPLSDHFLAIAPPGGIAGSFHQFCHQRLRAAGTPPDFSMPEAFTQMVENAAKLPIRPEETFDTIIIDEGQDFSPEWQALILRHAHPNTRLIWLEDPLQNLYQRAPIPFPGWVRLQASGNYRNPRPIVRLLQALLPQLADIDPLSPFDQPNQVELISYNDLTQLHASTKEAIRRCYADGFRHTDLVLLSYHGINQSQLFGLQKLGPHQLRRFTGTYSTSGHPLYSDGDILLESVYRFKGQAAPAVVFTEIDFNTLDEHAARKLFVGATRASMKLILVLTQSNYDIIIDSLDHNR